MEGRQVTPHDWQKPAIEQAVALERAYLYGEVGSGKSIIGGCWIENALIAGCRRVLILAPPKVCEKVWTEEHVRNFVDDDVVYVSLRDDPDGRWESLMALHRNQPAVVVCSLNMVSWLCDNFWWWDCVLIDECTPLANNRSVQGNLLRKMLRKHEVEWRLVMSGTPLHKGLLAAWGQYHLVDDGATLGRSFGKYRDATHIGTTPHPGAKYMKYSMREGAVAEVAFAVEHMTITVIKPEAERIPVDHHVLRVKLPARVMKAYRALDRGKPPKDFPLNSHAGHRSQQKRQMAQGLLLRDEFDPWPTGAWCIGANNKLIHVHDVKRKALERRIRQARGPMVVFTQWKADFAAIKQATEDAGKVYAKITEKGAVERWNDRQIDVLAMHPLSGGHGLNLQFGGSYIIWYAMPWSLEQYDQGNARLPRPGQDEKVDIVCILAEGTVDERMLLNLDERRETPIAWREAQI